MIQDTVLFKVFIRFLKEKNMFNTYKLYASDKYFNRIEEKLKTNPELISFLPVFSFSYTEIDSNKVTHINWFFNDLNNIIEFKFIINNLIKNTCISFLEENNILEKFITNVLNYNKASIANIIISNNINLSDNKYVYKISSTLINCFIEKRLSLTMLLDLSFNTNISKEGKSFWINKSKELKKYIGNVFIK